MLASLVLGFAILHALNGLVVVWLHLTPMRPCLDVTIWEVSPNSELLCAYPSFFCSMRCYAYYACLCHPLAFYASLHACLHVHAWILLLVCRPCFNTMKLWTFDPNLHLSLADTTFCLLSCLFAFSLVCFLSCFFACHIYHAYLLYAYFICFLHLFLPLLVCGSCLCLCIYIDGVRTHRARVWSSRRKQKGWRRKHVVISQTTMFSRFKGSSLSHLVMYFSKPPSFLPPLSLRWVVLGISCRVPFIPISRVWRPLFTFLHLYFGPCSRDVGIYFPALCACIVHDICIYIYTCSPLLVWLS